jgi:hypothetical protein
MEPTDKKLEDLHMESMVLHGSCALHRKVYAVIIVQKVFKSIHLGSA